MSAGRRGKEAAGAQESVKRRWERVPGLEPRDPRAEGQSGEGHGSGHPGPDSSWRLPTCVLPWCAVGSVVSPCDPMDGSPPGSSVHGVSQVRTLEWVAISSSRGLPDSGVKCMSPVSLASQADSLLAEPLGDPQTISRPQVKEAVSPSCSEI